MLSTVPYLGISSPFGDIEAQRFFIGRLKSPRDHLIQRYGPVFEAVWRDGNLVYGRDLQRELPLMQTLTSIGAKASPVQLWHGDMLKTGVKAVSRVWLLRKQERTCLLGKQQTRTPC